MAVGCGSSSPVRPQPTAEKERASIVLIQRAYKTALRPTRAQEEKLLHYSDVVRFAYNLFLQWSEDEYAATGKRPNTGALIKRFRAERAEKWPWTLGACSRCEETAARALDGGYKKFFEKVKAGKLAEMQKGKRPRKDGKPHGFPRFKRRQDGFVSCKFWGLKQSDVTDNTVRLRGLGAIKLHERDYLPTDGAKINCATVSQQGGRWFVSLQVEQDLPVEKACGPPIGVDVGISSLAVTSAGKHYDNPRALKAGLRKLKRLSRKLARQEKGSARRADTKARIARQHYRIGNVRRDALHKATADIVGVGRPADERPAIVGIEDLHVAGMVKNHHLAQAVSDASMAELHRQLEYKAAWNGSAVMKADRFYPSSKTCSECGAVLAILKLSERTFHCPECGTTKDRDENAALNLVKMV